MEISRNIPEEKLKRSTQAYRCSVWRRIGVGVVLASMLIYIASELIRGTLSV